MTSLPYNSPPRPDLPPVDTHLVAEGQRAELLEGHLILTPPSLEPHGRQHADLGYVLRSHLNEGYLLALDMLTRTGETSDFAPDASIYPEARDPDTEGRQLEELAFEIVNQQSLSVATEKARLLVLRGVRRVFCIDVKKATMMEFNRKERVWDVLDGEDVIEDRTLARGVVVKDLLEASRADLAVARALIDKNNPVIVEAINDAIARERGERVKAERERDKAKRERDREAAARQEAEQERDREATARKEAEAELARLRKELEASKSD